MATTIECISAVGKSIAPLVIYKGKQRQESWYDDVKDGEVFFGVSENGWTNADIALQWLQQDFDAQTKALAQGGYRLLLLDGHSSHTSYALLEYCLQNRIVPFCMPSHSTHHLQPLDVGVFGPYQHYYSDAVDAKVRLSHGVLNIGKHNFWGILQQARALAFTASTVKPGWAKSGLVPFNPRVVYSILPDEHTPEA